jgi:hypothetical protein
LFAEGKTVFELKGLRKLLLLAEKSEGDDKNRISGRDPGLLMGHRFDTSGQSPQLTRKRSIVAVAKALIF